MAKRSPAHQAMAVVSGLAVGACSVFGIRSGTEEPHYDTVARIGPVEIRHYAPRLAAETVVATDDPDRARSEGFRRIAGFIFGGNRTKQSIAMTAPVAAEPQSAKIAMTAPVEAGTPEGGGWRIRFFMPSSYTAETLPVPNDPRVQIVTLPASTYAVYRYSGSISQAHIADARAKLAAGLAGSGWTAAGTVADWFYDPPWTLPPLRRNEAAVPVVRQ
jgi:hypothetical protein